MKFKDRNLREIAEMVIGDNPQFPYRSSSRITRFFEECDFDFVHDGTTRWSWTFDRLSELLNDPQPAANALPTRFMVVLRTLMDKREAADDDPDMTVAVQTLNVPLKREGFEAYYAENDILHVRHIATRTVSQSINPHRPFTPAEEKGLELLTKYLDSCSEDQLIEEVLIPMFRQLGFHRITAAGHKDKALEYGKDIWMRYTLPTQHFCILAFKQKKESLTHLVLRERKIRMLLKYKTKH